VDERNRGSAIVDTRHTNVDTHNRSRSKPNRESTSNRLPGGKGYKQFDAIGSRSDGFRGVNDQRKRGHPQQESHKRGHPQQEQEQAQPRIHVEPATWRQRLQAVRCPRFLIRRLSRRERQAEPGGRPGPRSPQRRRLMNPLPLIGTHRCVAMRPHARCV
jgi:hypothetical protein